ncbi:DUF58 domain-containing protein [Paenibacillus sp. YPG26]|uniref:DUF58 domain-containing protein n=1 Tax=Paenibacillus sp. YPG26 TaxID=2878915 RepID=UPI002040479F|nr:DUF58 domain-containing protein [Paenibacillus sp. YPG26]USB34402.1 DUF58 domain-containing protein [Paenibacillus sp. YPG26]
MKRLWRPAVLWLVCLVYTLFQGGKTSIMLLMMVSILMVYWALSSWIGLRKISGSRSLSMEGGPGGQMQAGDQVQVKLNLEHGGWAPHPFIVVRETLKRHSGSSWAFEESVIPRFRSGAQISFQTPPLERGRYTFAETECSAEDIFGLIKHSRKFDFKGEFYVLPRTVFIPYWHLTDRNSRFAGPENALSLSRRETTQINGVREYVYGDRLSRIHWNATAKTGSWKSKEFEHESLPKTVMVLDASQGSYPDPAEFELAVSTVASLLDYSARERMSIGMCTVGSRFTGFLPTDHAEGRQRMIQHLVDIKADGQGHLRDRLAGRRELFAPSTFFVLISSRADKEILETLQWAKSNQMSPYHILIGEAPQNEQVLASLRQQGLRGIVVPSLQELPVSMRGGRYV